MAEMGAGYGSECHLLRFMGRHRRLFDQRILTVVGCDHVDWLDFGFNSNKTWPDAEIESLDFLPADHAARAAWKKFWPHGRGIHTWDAVGQAYLDDVEEWLLVEAKANLGELRSDCGAKSARSLATIKLAFDETKRALGVPEDRDWLHGYYQFCNRLAALYFLNNRRIPARLLYIYFVGDKGDARRICPQGEREWQDALKAQDTHVGLPRGHKLEDRVHKLFLPIVL
jgi:hypothetical protein